MNGYLDILTNTIKHYLFMRGIEHKITSHENYVVVEFKRYDTFFEIYTREDSAKVMYSNGSFEIAYDNLKASELTNEIFNKIKDKIA